jgi:hypothetical protein
MGNNKGMGLQATWVDVSAEKEEEFNLWYSEDYLPKMLTVPGILTGGHYVVRRGAPKHMVIFELECPEVVATEGFKRVKETPADWLSKASQNGSTPHIKNLYRLIFPDHIDAVFGQNELPPFIQGARYDVPIERDVEFNRWYHTVFIPGFQTVPGLIKGRRYITIEGKPRYLTIYDLEGNGAVSDSKEWDAARKSNPWTEKMRDLIHRDAGSPFVYEKVFPK